MSVEKHEKLGKKYNNPEEDTLEYCRERLKCYIILEEIYGHERACKILRLYDLKRS